jgi:hypothetical protein
MSCVIHSRQEETVASGTERSVAPDWSLQLTEAVENARHLLAAAKTPAEKEVAIQELTRAVKRVTDWTLRGIAPKRAD